MSIHDVHFIAHYSLIKVKIVVLQTKVNVQYLVTYENVIHNLIETVFFLAQELPGVLIIVLTTVTTVTTVRFTYWLAPIRYTFLAVVVVARAFPAKQVAAVVVITAIIGLGNATTLQQKCYFLRYDG